MNRPMKEATMTMEMFGASPAVLGSTPTTRKHHGRRALTLGIAASAALALFLGGMAGTASAGPTTGNVNVGSTLTLTGQTTAFTLSGPSSTTVTANAQVLLNVLTNNLAGYTVTIQAATPTLVAATPPNADSIPIANLSFRETGSTPWIASDDVAAVLMHTQATRSVAGGDALSNDFQVVIPFVNQDNYAVVLNYVAAVI